MSDAEGLRTTILLKGRAARYIKLLPECRGSRAHSRTAIIYRALEAYLDQVEVVATAFRDDPEQMTDADQEFALREPMVRILARQDTHDE